MLNGFFFGYFYPRLRGGNGFQKSIVLFLIISVPPLLYLSAMDRRDLWVTYGWATAQTLVFIAVLGVIVGDWWLVHRAGLRASDLLDLYRTRHMVAWVATIGTGVVGIVGTIVAGLLPVVLQSLGVEMSPQAPQR